MSCRSGASSSRHDRQSIGPGCRKTRRYPHQKACEETVASTWRHYGNAVDRATAASSPAHHDRILDPDLAVRAVRHDRRLLLRKVRWDWRLKNATNKSVFTPCTIAFQLTIQKALATPFFFYLEIPCWKHAVLGSKCVANTTLIDETSPVQKSKMIA